MPKENNKTSETRIVTEPTTQPKNHLPDMFREAANNPPTGQELFQFLYQKLENPEHQTSYLMRPGNLKALHFVGNAFDGWNFELTVKSCPANCSGVFVAPEGHPFDSEQAAWQTVYESVRLMLLEEWVRRGRKTLKTSGDFKTEWNSWVVSLGQ